MAAARPSPNGSLGHGAAWDWLTHDREGAESRERLIRRHRWRVSASRVQGRESCRATGLDRTRIGPSCWRGSSRDRFVGRMVISRADAIDYIVALLHPST